MEYDGETPDSTCENYMDFKMRHYVAGKKTASAYIARVAHNTSFIEFNIYSFRETILRI
jgi:hypothetical protein